MKKEEFITLYQSLTIKELCKVMNCSTTMIYSLLDRYGIPKKRNNFRDFSYLKGQKKKRINLD